MFGQHLSDGVWKGANTGAAVAEMAPASDAFELSHHLAQAFRRRQRRGQAENQGDQPPHCLRHRGGVTARLADVGEDLKGFLVAVDIHRDKSRAKRCGNSIRYPLDLAWSRLDSLTL